MTLAREGWERVSTQAKLTSVITSAVFGVLLGYVIGQANPEPEHPQASGLPDSGSASIYRPSIHEKLPAISRDSFVRATRFTKVGANYSRFRRY